MINVNSSNNFNLINDSLFPIVKDAAFGAFAAWGTVTYSMQFFSRLTSPSQEENLAERNMTLLQDGAYMISYGCWVLDILKHRNIVPIGEWAYGGMHAFALVRYAYELSQRVNQVWTIWNTTLPEEVDCRSMARFKNIYVAIVDGLLYFSLLSFSLLSLTSSIVPLVFSNTILIFGLVFLIASIANKILYSEEIESFQNSTNLLPSRL